MIQQSEGKIEKTYKVVIEKNYNHPVEKIWKAITDSDHVSQWMEYKAEIDLKIGGKYFVNFGDEGDLNGIITTLIPSKKIFYAWDDSIVMWELEKQNDSTKLKFSHNGLTSEKAIELGSGWEAFIDYLQPHLEGQPFPKNRHEMLLQQYQQMILS